MASSNTGCLINKLMKLIFRRESQTNMSTTQIQPKFELRCCRSMLTLSLFAQSTPKVQWRAACCHPFLVALCSRSNRYDLSRLGLTLQILVWLLEARVGFFKRRLFFSTTFDIRRPKTTLDVL